MKNVFGKEFRLLNFRDFAYLKNDSLKFNHPLFRVYFKKTLNLNGHSRIGISISRKVCKAHLRNKLKRKYREFFRSSELKTTGLDLFLTISPHIFKINSIETGLLDYEAGLNKLEVYLLQKFGTQAGVHD
ncbi:MAG: ribonuclease P protein component [Bacteriovoracaceae bacterium]|jgi:ribonuclease P protein component|nr:ribonuclease P protein component [Bacteriovoracaceae bacterium]